ncbi:MAG TPA: response regulator [Ruminiclostridium sp.]
MIRTLIVDDEELLRKGLIALIDWQSIGFEIVGEAGNGLEALELIKKNPVDVIVVDIRMPIIDGIGLMKKIKEDLINVRVIVLSGYDDFKYAQSAISCGASAYILKPAEEEEVMKALLTVKEEILKELSEKESKRNLKDSAKNNFLNRLLEGNISQEQYSSSIEELNINFIEEYFCIALIMLDHKKKLKAISTEFNLLKNEIFKKCKDIFYISYSGELFLNNTGDIIVIFSGEESIYGKDDFLQEVRSFLFNSYKVTCTIGIGLKSKGPGSISKSYFESSEALKYRITFGRNMVIDYSRILGMAKYILKYPLNLEVQIINSITTGNEANIKKYVEMFFEDIFNNRVLSCDSIKPLLQELLISIKRYFKWQKSTHISDLQGVIDDVNSYNDMKEVETHIIDLLIKICIENMDYNNTSGKKIVDDVKKYVNENFAAKISLEDISEKFYISKSHFCRVFKEIEGVNFNKYINFVKIEKAKEMLKGSFHKNYEICEELGFKNTSHFNQLFKKVTGMTPIEYKNHS